MRYLPHKHNSTMVSDASPGVADPKMNESFVHTAQTSLEVDTHRMGSCGVPIQRLLTEISGRTVDGFFGGFGVVRPQARD